MNHNPLQRKLRSRIKKRPYKPGTIGLSNVSTQIQKRYHGVILTREDRKYFARIRGERFIPIIGGW